MVTESPASQLERAAQLRDGILDALSAGEWVRASESVSLAELAYVDLLTNEEAPSDVADEARKGRALCSIHRADLAIRSWQLLDAEAELDSAYAVLKSGRAEGELWRVTARIAERRGRWSSARAAWKKVVKLAGGVHEGVVADAQLRLAEIALHEGAPEKVDTHIDVVRSMGLDDAITRARIELLEADKLVATRDFDAALSIHKDLSRDLEPLPPDLRALVNLRRAEAEMHRSPGAAIRRVLRATESLIETEHPDGPGLGHGQMAVLALGMREPVIAALSAIGAHAAREGDTVAHGLLEAALASSDFDIDIENLEARHLQEALVGHLADPARALGIAWSELGTLKGLQKLAKPLAALGSTGLRVDVESRKVIESAELVGHRCSLTWDAPLGTLRDVQVQAPVLAPLRPVLFSPVPDQFIQATPPPVPRRTTSHPDDRQHRALVLLTSALCGVLVLLVLVVWGLVLSNYWSAPKQVAGLRPDSNVAVKVPAKRSQLRFLTDDGPRERVPTEFIALSQTAVVQIEGAGVVLQWSGGAHAAALPVGTYTVTRDGQAAEGFAIEPSAERCKIRWGGEEVLVTCD